MRNIPVILTGWRLMVTEEPALKMREIDGQSEIVTDREGANQYVVSVFAKSKGEKGEEIKVTLATDPGPGFEEGNLVELIGGTVSPYSFKNNRNETVSGLAWRATGLKPLL
jgi:hypothetical protein